MIDDAMGSPDIVPAIIAPRAPDALPGASCVQTEGSEKIAVSAVYRDFRGTTKASPSDFEAGVVGSAKASPGMVEATLDADGKPVYTGLAGGAIRVASKESFATWYRNAEGVNHATTGSIALWKTDAGTYVNRYGANGEQWVNTVPAHYCGNEREAKTDADGQIIPCTSRLGMTNCDKMKTEGKELYKCINTDGNYSALFVHSRVDGTPAFFPVDGDAFSQGELRYAQISPTFDPAAIWLKDTDASGNVILHNFSFTSEIRSRFKYDAGKTYRLEFLANDDLWVFINGKLALDLGGIHVSVKGAISLDVDTAAKLGMVDGGVYEMAVFAAERQSTSSELMVTFPPPCE
jgi:fibro-slime domain-containing protein